MKRFLKSWLIAILAVISFILAACKTNNDDDTPALVITPVQILPATDSTGILADEPELMATKSLADFKNELTSQTCDALGGSETLASIEAEITAAVQKTLLQAIIELGTSSPIPITLENAASLTGDANEIAAAWKVAIFKLPYWTTSADGSKIKATARVLVNCYDIQKTEFPWNLLSGYWFAQSDQVVLHNHVTITSNAECPTEDKKLLSENGLLYKIAFSNNMVVDPDYEGYGGTKDRVHPYLIQAATAKQCVDAVKAAIQWKNGYSTINGKAYKLRGLATNFDMYNFGYSQGGSVTLAVHNYIENNNLEDSLHFRGSYCGDGPYDPIATYKWYLSDEGGLYMPCVIPLILRSYLYYYKDSHLKGFALSDFLNEKIQNALKDGTNNEWELIDSKKYTTDEISEKLLVALGYDKSSLPKKIKASEMMTEAAVNPDSPAGQALLKTFEENNYANSEKWSKASHKKIILNHSRMDEVVPPVNLESLYSKFPNATNTLTTNYWGASSIADSMNQFASILGLKTNFTALDAPQAGAHVVTGYIFFANDILLSEKYKNVR